jgi:hypothetical protein
MRLLSRSSLGRVVLTRHALPVVLPVRFRMDFSGTLVLSFPGGAPPVSAMDGAVIALQAERLDPDTLTGSSVMVHGRAEAVAGGDSVRLVPEVLIGTTLTGTTLTRAALTGAALTGSRPGAPGGDPAESAVG